MKVKIQSLRDNTIIPQKAHSTDACFDVTASLIETVGEGGTETTVVYLGFSTEIPEGYKGVLVPRSSLTKTTWMMQNSPGQVDSGFRGELQMRFKQLLCFDNATKAAFKQPFPYKVGERVGQIYFEQVIDVELETSDKLSSTERGAGGFGSTNK